MNLLGWFLLALMLVWAFERFYLRGKKIGELAVPTETEAVKRFSRPGGPGPELQQAVATVREMALKIAVALQNHDIKAARQAFDTISDGFQYDAQFIPCDAGGVAAEWVLTPGADKSRRVLFMHGGGFVVGSPKSHRTISSRFAEVSGCAVLSIDYRMMPEHSHHQCMEDCRTAYRWILENGPDGPGKIEQLFIGGDSAGGNLTLSLIAWIRDNGLFAPQAVVALSPLTDVTFSGASIKENVETDHLLKPFMKPLVALSSFSKSWWVLWTYKVRPASPLVSPLFGDLSGLPPTLVQVSSAEMLLDDARRYVYKARAAGSDARLQCWDDMLHIWQIFYPKLPQAVEAWDEIGKFLVSHGAKPACPE